MAPGIITAVLGGEPDRTDRLAPTLPHQQADAAAVSQANTARAATISRSQQRPSDFGATSLTNIHN
jgi:hypothetical protein